MARHAAWGYTYTMAILYQRKPMLSMAGRAGSVLWHNKEWLWHLFYPWVPHGDGSMLKAGCMLSAYLLVPACQRAFSSCPSMRLCKSGHNRPFGSSLSP